MLTMPDIAKYKMEPRFATLRYKSRVLSISWEVVAAFAREAAISMDFALALFRVWMSSSLSRMLPFDAASSRSKVSSSCLMTCRLSDICCTSVCRISSRSGRSKPTTTLSNWAARPSKVMTQFTIEALPMTSGVYFGFISFVVIMSMKASFHSSWLSPNWIIFWPLTMVNLFSRMGSIIGSNSSSRFSNRNGLPYWMASSRNLMYSSLKVFTVSGAFSSFFLIQLTICIWGSTHKGHRDDLVTRMPFCTQSSSLGKPLPAHAAISTSDVSSVCSLKFWVFSISLSETCAAQHLSIMSVRKPWLKGPA
mmetsp:Transcript_105792/g.304199  ORF Transcript_105792/g.304199 Transcript_105792/m.304199 type:complete len:307 (+) Transcript_105792:2350-3270(+)